jgi:hypothetical protein
MAHYAILNNENVVTQVIVGVDENEPLPKGFVSWEQFYNAKRTSYNTVGNVHALGGTPYRKNYAGIGFTYDETRDAFIPPKNFSSWILNEDTCQWEPPIPMPEHDETERYIWLEADQEWYLIN